MPSLADATLLTWLETARTAADAAARVHIAAAGAVHADDARAKDTADFVSHVDEEAQRAALRVIGERHPDHLILAEEDDTPPALPEDDTPLWVVDPLDGTTNFLHGHPMHAASVALTMRGESVVGAVTCGPTGERWWAARGHGAWKSEDGVGPGNRAGDSAPRRIVTSRPRSMRRALIGTGFPFRDLERLEPYLDQLRRVIEATAGARRGGAAALDLCYVAEGRFDGFWEQSLSPWDWAAGACLITEAGGTIERVEGGPLVLTPGSSVLAGASEAFMLELRALLEGSRA